MLVAHSWETMSFSATQLFRQFSADFSKISTEMEIFMVPSERSSPNLLEYGLFKIQEIFFIYKNKILCEKINFVGFFLQFFFKSLPKFSDFINSNNCIEKSHQNLSDYMQVLLKFFFLNFIIKILTYLKYLFSNLCK